MVANLQSGKLKKRTPQLRKNIPRGSVVTWTVGVAAAMEHDVEQDHVCKATVWAKGHLAAVPWGALLLYTQRPLPRPFPNFSSWTEWGS